MRVQLIFGAEWKVPGGHALIRQLDLLQIKVEMKHCYSHGIGLPKSDVTSSKSPLRLCLHFLKRRLGLLRRLQHRKFVALCSLVRHGSIAGVELLEHRRTMLHAGAVMKGKSKNRARERTVSLQARKRTSAKGNRRPTLPALSILDIDPALRKQCISAAQTPLQLNRVQATGR